MSRDRAFELAVVDGGALGAVAVDIATRAVRAGYGHRGLADSALIDLLLGVARPQGPLTTACGGAPVSAARELLVVGRDRALYCMVVGQREVIIMATPASMSVALGWTLVRTLVRSGAQA